MKCSVNRYSCLITKIIMIAVLAVLIFACDNVNNPYQETAGKKEATGNTRKILLEEFTGFKCGNCPAANQKALELEKKYEGRIIPISIHAGGFALPDGLGHYTKDYRTTVGDDLYNFFGVLGTPNALISRTGSEGEKVIGPDRWEAVIDQLLDSEPEMLIKVFHEYNSETRELYLDIFITYLKDGSSNERLSLFLLEDNIIDWQVDYTKEPVDVEGYAHNNMLRGSINGTWGDPLSETDIPAGYTIRREYHYTIPEDVDWIVNNMKLVAFIHDYENTYEVLQAEEIHIAGN